MPNRSTKPIGSSSLPAVLEYEGHIIHGRDEMLSLTDMWKAAGADPSKQPAKWRELPSSREFAGHASAILRKSEDELFDTSTRRAGTWAHWQIALAYAKYLSPEFSAILDAESDDGGFSAWSGFTGFASVSRRLALQLRFRVSRLASPVAGLTASLSSGVCGTALEVGLAGGGLMRPSPERPCDDVGGPDAPLCQSHRDAADLLHRPADQRARRLGGRGLGRARLFGGGALA